MTGRLEKNVKENNAEQENQNGERKQIAEHEKNREGKTKTQNWREFPKVQTPSGFPSCVNEDWDPKNVFPSQNHEGKMKTSMREGKVDVFVFSCSRKFKNVFPKNGALPISNLYPTLPIPHCFILSKIMPPSHLVALT